MVMLMAGNKLLLVLIRDASCFVKVMCGVCGCLNEDLLSAQWT
jgi:hypothetical protein